MDGLQQGENVWAEGLPPESLAPMAAAMASQGRRVLFVAADDAQISLHATRLSPRVPTRLLRSSATRSQMGRLPELVLCSHQNLNEETLARLFGSTPPDYVLVEDAHVVVPQSHDYRPRLERLAPCLRRWQRAHVVLSVPRGHRSQRSDIESRLRATTAEALHRPPIHCLEVFDDRNHLPLVALIERLPRPAVVLCATPCQADEAYQRLAEVQIPVHRFHAGLSAGERASELVRFTLPGRRAVMVATSALGAAAPLKRDPLPEHFGSGYGRADIKSLVHLCAPASLCQYARELSLLGPEDSEGLHAVLTFSPQHLAFQEALLSRKRPHPEVLHAVVEALLRSPKGSRIEIEAFCSDLTTRKSSFVAVLDYLVELGAVARQTGEFWSRVEADQLERAAERLATDFETLLNGDEARLAELRQYATSTSCRQVRLASLLNEPTGSPCGVCDQCQPGDILERAPLPQKEPEPAPEPTGTTGEEKAREPRRRKRAATKLATPTPPSESSEVERLPRSKLKRTGAR